MLRRHMRLVREFFRACLVEEFEYRANFAANVFMTLFTLAMSVLTVYLFFYRTSSIGGWSLYEVLALLGIFNAMHGLIDFFLQPNMSRLVNHIREGTLDYVLIKPVDSQFYISFRHLVFWRLADVALGFGLVGYSLYQLQRFPSVMEWIVFVLIFISGVLTVYSMWITMMTFSFWAVKIDNLSYLFMSVFEAARYPVTVYSGILQIVVYYLVPIVFITTYPAGVLVGKLDWMEGLGALATSVVLFAASRQFWIYAVKRYTSASS